MKPRHKKSKATENLVYGFHAVMPLLNDGKLIQALYVSKVRGDKRMQEIIEQAQQAHIAITYCEKAQLDKMTDNGIHQGVAAQLHTLQLKQQNELPEFLQAVTAPLILVLDQVQDPHNLGACLRTAECAGVDAVILPKHGACPVNATVRKVAAGAADRLTLFEVTNLSRALQTLQEAQVWLTATSDKATKDFFAVDYRGGAAIVMGAEGLGVRHLTAEQCDQLVRIPMAGEVSSLNVSVATGIMLFEARRQRGYGSE